MVKIFFRGKEVGSLDENPDELRTLLDGRAALDVVSDSGAVLASLRQGTEPICPWEPGLTAGEIDRRCQQPGKSLAEILQRIGAE